MTTFIAPAALGLGDLIVVLPVVQTLIDGGIETVLVLRLLEHCAVAERLPGLNGFVMDWHLDSLDFGAQDLFIDLRDHSLQRDHWWGSQAFEDACPGMKINDILSVICRDKGLTVDFYQSRPLRFYFRGDCAGKIAFIPGSAVSSKSWPLEHWLELNARLAARGESVLVVGQPQESPIVRQLIDAGLSWMPTPLLSEAVDVVSSCKAVVSVDTGLMHVAAHQGVPTVGMYKKFAVYVRPFDNVVSLISDKSCEIACHQREQQAAHHKREMAGEGFKPADWSCAAQLDGLGCMETISVEAVWQGLMSLSAKAYQGRLSNESAPGSALTRISS